MGRSRATSDQRALRPRRCTLAIESGNLAPARTALAGRRTTLTSPGSDLASSRCDFRSPERDLPPPETARVDAFGHLPSERGKLSSMRIDLATPSWDARRERVRVRGRGSDFAAVISYVGTDGETLTLDCRKLGRDGGGSLGRVSNLSSAHDSRQQAHGA